MAVIHIQKKLKKGNVQLPWEQKKKDVYKRQEYILKNEVDWIKDQYDFIIIDCPPSLNMLTVNAMTTANTVLVPIDVYKRQILCACRRREGSGGKGKAGSYPCMEKGTRYMTCSF